MIDFGLSPREFQATYQEKQAHLRPSAVGGDPFRWSELDELLHQIEPRAPMVQLFNNGLVPEDEYTNQSVEFGMPRRRLNKHRFYDELRRGATLVINRLENYSLRAKRLCAEVGRFTSRPAIGNAYLSFGGRGTFGRHWDTHDVFALQLLGKKRWLVYPPTFPLPVGPQVSDGRDRECPSEPVIDCVLTAGDLLYIPRGWWHQAIPFEEASLHLSVGTYGPTVHDYLMWACSRYALGIEDARRSLTPEVGQAEVESVVRSLASIVLDPGCRAEFERDMSQRERLSSEFNTELFLGTGADGLERGALVSLNGCRAPDPSRTSLIVNGVDLRLSPLSMSIVSALADAPYLPIDALYSALPNELPEHIRLAVLDLAQHEVVSIAQPSNA